MKINISYTAPEAAFADKALKWLRVLFPGCRIHANAKNEYRHLYITTNRERTENEQKTNRRLF